MIRLLSLRSPVSTLGLALALAAAPGCKKPEDAAGKAASVALPPVAVEAAHVEIRRMPRFLTLTGSVVADRQSEVAANVNGRIATTYVERGMPVKQGQPIALVDSKAAGFSASAATAQQKMAEAQVAQAQSDCDRADGLFAQGALSKAEHDRLHTQCTAQLFQANAARANADLAEKLAGDTVIRAPFSGVVGERYVNPGEYVQAMTKVASLYAQDPVRVNVSVPESAVALVRDGQMLDVHVAAYPDRGFPATVKFIGPALRAQTRDLLVEARAANADGALKPGMFATVQLAVGDEELPTVPEDAIRAEGTVKRLFLARDGQAFELVVRTGIAKDGRIAVLEPLDAKTQVIRRPPPGLRDGASITIATARAPSSENGGAKPATATAAAEKSGAKAGN